MAKRSSKNDEQGLAGGDAGGSDNEVNEAKNTYRVGAVGSKGQAFDSYVHQEGDIVELSEEQAEQHRSHGVPLHDAPGESPTPREVDAESGGE